MAEQDVRSLEIVTGRTHNQERLFFRLHTDRHVSNLAPDRTRQTVRCLINDHIISYLFDSGWSPAQRSLFPDLARLLLDLETSDLRSSSNVHLLPSVHSLQSHVAESTRCQPQQRGAPQLTCRWLRRPVSKQSLSTQCELSTGSQTDRRAMLIAQHSMLQPSRLLLQQQHKAHQTHWKPEGVRAAQDSRHVESRGSGQLMHGWR
eukprot:753921-Hanusia_phi.AAC.3